MNRGFALLCSVILILAACSSGDDDQARTVPEPTSSASPSSSATERSEAPSTEDESPVALTEEESPAAPTEEQPSSELDSIVLTLDDMPSGWTTDPELAGDDDSSTGTAFCGVEDADLDVDGTGGESVDAAFKQSDFGPFVLNSVALAPTSEAASEAMDAMLEAASQCTEWTETDDEGAETTYAISPLSFDNVGDDTIAFRISADADGLALTIDMVMWHTGPLVSIVALLGIGGTDPEILTDLVETVASRM